MNFYILLLILCISVMSVSADRTRTAKLKWLRVMKIMAENKKKDTGPNEPQTRFNRHAHRIYIYKGGPPKTDKSTTTTTTKSPLDIIREEEEKERDRNPKNVQSLEKDIRKFKKELEVVKEKYLKVKCTTNDDCANGTCCMIDISDGYCQKPPTEINEQCSEFCPCRGESMDCKTDGHNNYIKKCLAKDVPETLNLRLVKILKEAKSHLDTGRRVPRQSDGGRDKSRESA